MRVKTRMLSVLTGTLAFLMVFTGVALAATVTSTNPSSRGQGATSQNVTVNGTGFQSDATVSFDSGITVNSTTFVDATQLIANITVAPTATVGVHVLTVAQGLGGLDTASCASCFTVNAAPTATSASPLSRGQGATSQTVTITGTGFQDGATVAFSGSGVAVASTTFVSATSLTTVVNVASDAATGARTITVTNPDAATPATCADCLTVNAAPTPTSASPSSRGQGATSQTVTITGTGFQDGATVAFSGSGVTVASTTFVSATSLTTVVNVASDAATGARTITVTNPDAGVKTCPACFTVNAAPTATITLPASLDDLVSVDFSHAVSGVTESNFVLRNTGTGSVVDALLLCADSAGDSGSLVDCGTGPVATAALFPYDYLTAGQRYSVTVNPSEVTPAKDSTGSPVPTTVRAFRASKIEQESSFGARFVWRGVRASGAHGGSYVEESLAGASVWYLFAGTSVTWYTVTGPNKGTATVTIDGVNKGTFNQYASSAHYKVARTFSGLTDDIHEITIKVTGKKGSSSGTGTLVAVDAFKWDGVVDASPDVDAFWKRFSASSASGGKFASSPTKGANVWFSFRGTGVDWYTVTGTNQGKATVYIDGVSKGTFDNYSSSTKYGVRRSFRGLSDEEHTIRIVVAGTKNSSSSGTYVAVDRWVVV
ncbi:MAG: IPT/TIG domain-containing protein [Actinomycetota bacterium]